MEQRPRQAKSIGDFHQVQFKHLIEGL